MANITQRIANIVTLTLAEDMDLLTASGIQVFIRQRDVQLKFDIPSAVSDTKIQFGIPYEKAMLLEKGNAEIQVAWTDSNDTPRNSKPKTININEFIYEGGYNA